MQPGPGGLFTYGTARGVLIRNMALISFPETEKNCEIKLSYLFLRRSITETIKRTNVQGIFT